MRSNSEREHPAECALGRPALRLRDLFPFDDLLESGQPLRLHRAHASSRHEPHARPLGVTIDDLHAVVRDRVMERGAWSSRR